MAEKIAEKRFKVAIVDEAHYLKNLQAKRTMRLTPILQKCKRVVLLSGTPAEARPMELFNLLSIIRPDVFTKFADYGVRYCDPKPSAWKRGWEYKGATCMRELHIMLSSSLMIRRLKKDVLSEMPSKQRSKVQIQADEKVIKKIQNLLKLIQGETGMGNDQEVLDSLLRDFGHQGGSMNLIKDKSKQSKSMGWLSQCFALTAEAKVKASVQFMNDLIENGMKILMFAHHKIVLDGLEASCKKKKTKYMRIDGTVKPNHRHERV